MRMVNKVTLSWYKTKKVGWAEQLLFKARTKSLEVNKRTYRWNENMKRMCMDETMERMFLECEGYANEREVLFAVVSESVEGNEWRAAVGPT